MSTQQSEDVSEAVVAPSAAAVDPSSEADALSADDTAAVDDERTGTETADSTADLAQAANSAETEAIEEVEQNSAPSPTADFSKKLSENASS